MPRRSPALAAALLLASAQVLAARHLPGPAAAVRWLEPAPGAELTAGGRVAFAWQPGPEYSALGAIDEWELFLSYDDGASWPVRLSPHLDIDRRRFEVELPDLSSERARFLMRIGDERLEYEIELAGSWRIEPGRRDIRRRDVVGSSRIEASSRRGESARDGAPGVALWLDGSRAGERLRWRSYEPAAAEVERSSWFAGGLPPPLGTPERGPSTPAGELASSAPTASRARAALAAALPLPTGVSLLLRTCRRNE